MKTLWMEVSALTGGSGRRFSISAAGVRAACLHCNAVFPQTDAGWAALKEHGFEWHEQIKSYDWSELDGLDVTLGVVRREDGRGEVQTELIARTDDGTVYFLPFSYYHADDDGGFKCKPKSRASSLLRLTLPDRASQSSG